MSAFCLALRHSSFRLLPSLFMVVPQLGPLRDELEYGAG